MANIHLHQGTVTATKRDGFVDFFKGALILWVIHIHTVFWSGQYYLPEIARQTSLLIDVAAFVFISGYLTKSSDFASSLRKSIKQLISLYSNYIAFSCLLLIPLYFIFLVKDKAIPDLPLAIISMLVVDPIGVLWGDIPAYQGSIWYIAVYLSALILLPVATRFFGSPIQRITTLLIVFLLFCFSRYLDWDYNLFFYQNTFVYFYLLLYLIGMTYRASEKNIPTRALKSTFVLNIVLCLIVFLYFDSATLDLQSKKFPPSLEYLAYSSILIHIFVILKRVWRYADAASTNKFLQFFEWCGKNIYFIYLFQGLVCSAPLFFVSALKNHIPILALYFSILTFNIFFTLLLTFIYLRFKAIFTSSLKL